jgi:hypothetical protein
MESSAHSHYIIQSPEVVTELSDRDRPAEEVYLGVCHGCWFGYIGGPRLVESGDLTPKVNVPSYTAYTMSEQFEEDLIGL